MTNGEDKRILFIQPLAKGSVDIEFHISYLRNRNYFEKNMANLPFVVKEFGEYPCRTFPIDANRNESVAFALDNKFDYTVWFDTDMEFPDDAAFRMLANMDKYDVVSGMYYMKEDPLRYRDESFYKYFTLHPVMFKAVDDTFTQFNAFIEFPKTELFYADLIGMGCVCINTDVFRKIKPPWFKYQVHPIESIHPEAKFKNNHGINDVSEDVWFCKQVHEAGIKIVVDPNIQCGHLGKFNYNHVIYNGIIQGVKTAFMRENGEEQFNLKWSTVCRAEPIKNLS